VLRKQYLISSNSASTIPEPIIPEDIPEQEFPRLLREWHLGSKAKRHLSRRRFASVTGQLGDIGNGRRALDIGCGWGYNLYLLHRAGYETYVIDILQMDFPVARTIARPNSFGTRLMGADMSALPFNDGVFGAVTAVEVLEHVFAPDRERALREVARVLAPRGTFVLSTPNANSPLEIAKKLLVRSPRLQGMLPIMCYPARDIPRSNYHPYEYHKPVEAGELKAMLESTGFEAVSMRKILFVLKTVPDWLFSVAHLAEWVTERVPVLRRLGSTLVVTARKRDAGVAC